LIFSGEHPVNVNVNAAASIAGTSRAAARGGEADAQATEATRQQATAETPSGKAPDAPAVDAGDQTSDRDGHGQQVLDVFERSKRDQHDDSPEGEEDQDETRSQTSQPPSENGSGSHLDFEA
jgi:hypothetical protein